MSRTYSKGANGMTDTCKSAGMCMPMCMRRMQNSQASEMVGRVAHLSCVPS